jgi:cytochrome c553
VGRWDGGTTGRWDDGVIEVDRAAMVYRLARAYLGWIFGMDVWIGYLNGGVCGLTFHGSLIMRTLSAVATIFVLGLSSAAFAADGAELFAKNCGSCHGADGKAESPAAKAMKVPAVAGHAVDGTLSEVRGSDKHKAVSGKLSDEELQAVADYLASL